MKRIVLLTCVLIAMASLACSRYGNPGDPGEIPDGLKRHIAAYKQCRGYAYREMRSNFTTASTKHSVCVAYLWTLE